MSRTGVQAPALATDKNPAEAGCVPTGCALVLRARLYVACFNDTLYIQFAQL